MKAVIFDLDGTLVESLPGLTDALNRLLTDLGRPTEPASVVRSYIGDGQWMLIRRALPTEEFSDTQIDELQAPFQRHYTEAWPEGTVIYEGLMPMLQQLHEKGVQLGVLSNKKHPFTVEIVEHLFGRELMPLIYGQRDGITKKPDPAALISICEETGIPASEVCYIGDSTVDLETAKSAGTKAIGVTWGYHDKPRLEPYGFPLCDSVADLQDVLMKAL